MTANDRETLYFDSHGDRCHAWFYRAELAAGDQAPCIVLAHGFGSVKTMRLGAYAEAFCRAGYHALVFDYRHFGDSEGQPRQLVNVKKQLQDWHAALACARGLDGVDSTQLVLWGTSFSGGHVAQVAAQDRQVAAVISQVPHMNGLASGLAQGKWQAVRLTFAGIRDAFRALFGRKPLYLPAVGEPGSMAAMSGKGELEAAEKLYPAELDVDRSIAARIVLLMAFYSPGKVAKKIAAPWLVQIASNDITTPIGPAKKAANRAPHAELVEYDGGHFDVYVEPLFSRLLATQLDFLGRVLGSDERAQDAA